MCVKSYAVYAIKLKDIRLCRNRTSHKVVATSCAYTHFALNALALPLFPVAQHLTYMHCSSMVAHTSFHISQYGWGRAKTMLLLMKEEEEEEEERAYVSKFYCHARLENVIKYPITLWVCGALCELKHVQWQTNVRYTSTRYSYFACGMALLICISPHLHTSPYK